MGQDRAPYAQPQARSRGKSTAGGRPPKYQRREILNALFYMTKAICTWRMLPHDLPPWEVVYMYLSQWPDEGVFERINEVLRKQVRIGECKNEEPAAVMDSQSVKTAEKGPQNTLGYDAGKKVKGGKRHIFVDTMGLLLVVVVHWAGVQDRDGARQLL